MNDKYKANPEAMKVFGRMLHDKLSTITQSPFYQREVGRELDISNSSVSRLAKGSLEDVRMSTFIALCKYCSFSDEEILYLYHLALYEDYDMFANDKIKQKLKKIVEIIES